MNNVIAIFIKQLTSHIKVPTIIIHGLMFLGIAVAFLVLIPTPDDYDCDVCIPAYECATCEEREAERFQLPFPTGMGMFTIIFIGLALVGSMSGIVHEDKTTTNLRFMAMADVKPWQYLVGTFFSTVLVVGVMLVPYAILNGIIGGYWGADMLWFMILTLSGGIVSILFGLTIGLTRFQILAWPISMVLGMGPQFALQNETLAGVLRYTFIMQVTHGLTEISEPYGDITPNLLIIAANGAVVLAAFFIMHRKNKFNV
jgi:ABC-2 type transport system permease protein